MSNRSISHRQPTAALVGLRVRVYLNLHRPGHLSVVALEGPQKGRVVAHTLAIALTDCRFVVSEAGRQRVIREQAKNVHAAIQGTIRAIAYSAFDVPGFQAEAERMRAEGCLVYYNPYRTTLFLNRDTQEPLHDAAAVIALGSQVVALPG